MATILLIGTVHGDLNGARRLERALHVERPDVLTLEANQKVAEYLEKNSAEDREMILSIIKGRGVKPETLTFFGEILPTRAYELDVCRAYAAKTGVPLHLIDDPSIIDSMREEILSQFRTFFGTIDPKILDEVTRESVTSGHDSTYQYIQSLCDGKIPASFGEQKMINPNRGRVIGRRDETEAGELTQLAGLHPGAKIVHVGGCIHNLDDSRGETLYSRLVGLKPLRRTLLAYEF